MLVPEGEHASIIDYEGWTDLIVMEILLRMLVDCRS